MRIPTFLFSAAALLISTGPLFAFNACDRLTGDAKMSCFEARRVPISADPCRILAGSDAVACNTAKEQFDKVNAGLNLQKIVDLALCLNGKEWPVCFGTYITPVPDAIPDPGPYARKNVAMLSASDRAKLRNDLQVAIQANTEYLGLAVDEIIGPATQSPKASRGGRGGRRR